MKLPELNNWESTAQSLHKAAQILGALRLLVFERQSNWLELAMKPVPQGLSTDVMPGGGELILDFANAEMQYKHSNGELETIKLVGHSQNSLLKSVLQTLQKAELAQYLGNAQENDLIETFYSALKMKNHPLIESQTQLDDEARFEIDLPYGRDYATVLYSVFTGVARFRAHLLGHMTPLVVWPEHFDLSTLWFVDPAMDDGKAHLNFGFAPFSAGFPQPYLYAYAYPYPPNLKYPALPQPAYWNFKGWTGVVVDYAKIVEQENPAQFIEELCLEIFKVLRGLI
jgi:Family of unknown function (DUF5996)